ncbi:hypothetical protein ACQKEM_12155 [Pseudomonas sp. NPDC077382]
MLENVVSGLIVAAILWLTAFAWNSPSGYKSLYNYIWGIGIFSMMFVLFWNIATDMFLDYFKEFIEIEKYIEAREKLKFIQAPLSTFLAVYTGVFLYTASLLLIPKIKPKIE